MPRVVQGGASNIRMVPRGSQRGSRRPRLGQVLFIFGPGPGHVGPGPVYFEPGPVYFGWKLFSADVLEVIL